MLAFSPPAQQNVPERPSRMHGALHDAMGISGDGWLRPHDDEGKLPL
ncbi:hypothetical protein ACKI2N_007705 [Cupriavidus sp. 30B13]